jgi:hypothetical protein
MVARARKSDNGTYPTVLSPSIRERDVERKLRRFLKLLTEAERGNILNACREAGTTINTFYRYRDLYATGGKDAVRKALRHRGASMFQGSPRTLTRLR